MKRILSHLVAVIVAAMPLLAIHGENIPHNFQVMNTPPSTIEFSSGNKVARSTTDGITYTCGGDATFAVVNYQTGIKLYYYGDNVIVAPAIEGLFEVSIGYDIMDSGTFNPYDIEVYISPDGVSWGSSISAGRTHASGLVTVTIPRGNYQLKIRNKGGRDIFITNMIYFYEHCNCFRYVP